MYLGLKRKEINKDLEQEGASIDTDYFRYYLYAEQSKEIPHEYNMQRSLYLRQTSYEIMTKIDSIFLNKFDEIVIPISGTIDFEELVNKFENYVKCEGGDLNENDKTGKIIYVTKNSIKIIIDTKAKEFAFKYKKTQGINSLIQNSRNELKQLIGSQIKLLE